MIRPGRGGPRVGYPVRTGQAAGWIGVCLMFRAIADVLRQIGGAIATVVTLPFRALARLFGGASSGRA